MKYTSALLVAVSFGAATATAGVATSYTGMEQTTTTPAPSLDRCAGPISYSNIELLYASTDWGFGDRTGGGSLRAEYSPVDHFYLTASVDYSNLDSDFVQDVWDFSVGLGGYTALTENIHLAADVGYINRRYDDVNDNGTIGDALDDFWQSGSDSGWYARPHLRGKWGCFEAHVGAVYRNLDVDADVENDFFDGGGWAWFGRIYYRFSAKWDLTGGYENGDEAEQLTVGMRYRF